MCILMSSFIWIGTGLKYLKIPKRSTEEQLLRKSCRQVLFLVPCLVNIKHVKSISLLRYAEKHATISNCKYLQHWGPNQMIIWKLAYLNSLHNHDCYNIVLLQIPSCSAVSQSKYTWITPKYRPLSGKTLNKSRWKDLCKCLYKCKVKPLNNVHFTVIKLKY